MKTVRLFFLSLFCFLLSTHHAQATHIIRGIITLQLIDDSQPLAFVQVKVNQGSPTSSNSFGEFEVTIPDLKPGEDLIIHVIKKDYEVVNKHVLINPNPNKIIRIVMCKTGERDKWARKFYDLAETSIYENYDKAKKTIQSLERNNIERELKIQNLEKELQQNLQFAKQLAEQLAEKNLSETSVAYKKALKYFVNGQVDSAKMVFSNVDLDLQDKKNAKDRLFYAQLLVLDQNYEDAEKNFVKAIRIFEDDETISGYADFLFQKGDYQTAFDFYREALKVASEKQDSIIILKKIGSSLNKLQSNASMYVEYFELAYGYWSNQLNHYTSPNNIIQFYTTGQDLRSAYLELGQRQYVDSILQNQYLILNNLIKATYNNINDSADLHYSYANLYYFLGDLFDYSNSPNQAIYYYNKSLHEYGLVEKIEKRPSQQIELAKVYYSLNKVGYRLSNDVVATLSNNDSLINIYKRLGEKKYGQEIINTLYENFMLSSFNYRDRGIQYALQAFNLLNKKIESKYFTNENLRQILELYGLLGLVSYYQNSDFESSKPYFFEGIKKSDEYNNYGNFNYHKVSGDLTNLLGTVYLMEYVNSKKQDTTSRIMAEKYLLESIERFKKDSISSKSTRIHDVLKSYSTLLTNYLEIEAYPKMLESYENAMQYIKLLGFEVNQLGTQSKDDVLNFYAILYNYYENQSDRINQLRYLEKYADLASSRFSYHSSEYTAEVRRIGAELHGLKNVDKARIFLDLALENIIYFDAVIDSSEIGVLHYNLGKVYMDLEELDIAENHFKSSLLVYKNLKNISGGGVLFTFSLSVYEVPKKEITNSNVEKPTREILNNFIRLADIAFKKEQYKTAHSYLDTAIIFAKNEQVELELFDHLVALKIYHHENNQKLIKSELDSITKDPLLTVSIETFDNLYLLFASDPRLSESAAAKNKKYLRKKLLYWENIAEKSVNNKSNSYSGIANCYYYYKDYDSALKHILLSIENEDSILIGSNLDHIHHLILASQIYHKLGNNPLANENISKAIELIRWRKISEPRLLNKCIQLQREYSGVLQTYLSEAQITSKNRNLHDTVLELLTNGQNLESQNPDSASACYTKAVLLNMEILKTQPFAIYYKSLYELYYAKFRNLYNRLDGIEADSTKNASARRKTLIQAFNSCASLLDSAVLYLNEYVMMGNNKDITLQKLSAYYGEKSWCNVLGGNYTQAESDARAGVTNDRKNQNGWIYVNLLWAYIGSQKKDLADELLDQMLNNTYTTGDGTVHDYKEVIRKDFEYLLYLGSLKDELSAFKGRIDP